MKGEMVEKIQHGMVKRNTLIILNTYDQKGYISLNQQFGANY